MNFVMICIYMFLDVAKFMTIVTDNFEREACVPVLHSILYPTTTPVQVAVSASPFCVVCRWKNIFVVCLMQLNKKFEMHLNKLHIYSYLFTLNFWEHLQTIVTT